MTTTSATSSGSGLSAAMLDQLNGSKAATTVSAAKEQSDRFLKLLTTQLKNQDPLNPMDNAQMTSQMAQISTVSGIETMNASMQSLTSQIVQLQTVQGAAMVGRTVLTEGDRLSIHDDTETGTGSFDLPSNATSVRVEVLSASGGLVDTVNLGAQTKGRHAFEWDAGSVPDSANYRFRVVAQSSGTPLTTTTLQHDTVQAVQAGAGELTLQLARGGSVAWSDIKSLN